MNIYTSAIFSLLALIKQLVNLTKVFLIWIPTIAFIQINQTDVRYISRFEMKISVRIKYLFHVRMNKFSIRRIVCFLSLGIEVYYYSNEEEDDLLFSFQYSCRFCHSSKT